MRTITFLLLVGARLAGPDSAEDNLAAIFYGGSALWTHWAMCKAWDYFTAKPITDYKKERGWA